MSQYPQFSPVDSNGNILGASGTPSSVTQTSTVQTFITYPTGTAQAASNAGVSFSTATTAALAVDITLTSFTGGTSPTVTFFVDRLGSDGIWYRVWTSAALSNAGTTSVQIGPFPSGTGIFTAVLTGTCRFGWSSTNAPTAITFSASVIGR